MAKRATNSAPSSSQKNKTAVKKKPSKNASPTATTSKRRTLEIVERPEDFKGIEQLVFVNADSLTENPENWKTHTKRQLQSLDSEFSTVGWALPMVYNLTTGRLIDGHGRKQTEHVKRTGIVPVVVGRWSETEERQLLLHLDPIGAMFETDSKRYDALMSKYREDMQEITETIDATHTQQLEQLNKDLDLHTESLKYGGPKSFLPDFKLYDEEYDRQEEVDPNNLPDTFTPEQVPPKLPGALDLKTWHETPFNAFAPNGPFDIPNLRHDKLAQPPSGKIICWHGPETPNCDQYLYIYGSAAIEKVRSNNMIVAFYTYDDKFESIWNDPRKLTARMLNMQIPTIVSPNYSVWQGCPFAYEIWQQYRSRWLSRYWQELGFNIIPDILCSNFDRPDSFELRMTGIPIGLPCISLQCHTLGDIKPERYFALFHNELSRVLDHLKPESVLLYHGTSLPKNFLRDFSDRAKFYPVLSFMTERQKVLNAKEYLK